mgnify:CR=1 FL=1
MKITQGKLKQIIQEELTKLQEGDPASRLIHRLEVALGTIEGAMGYIENQAALERLQKGLDIGNEVWEAMHDMLPQAQGLSEEKK